MPQETLGYVNLEWTCPKCKNRNPGLEKTCLSCGAPQPQDVQFVQGASQELKHDEVLKKAAEAGADIHCAFCGTRNPAGATVCSQCGADLKSGTRREAGRVVGAYQTGPVKQIACPSCGSMNSETALKCANCGAQLKLVPAIAPAASPEPSLRSNRWLWLGGAVLAILCLIAIISFAFLSAPRTTQKGIVEDVEWQTIVNVEELGPVSHSTWQDEIPQGAQVGNCEDQVRETVDQQPSSGNFNKVCGTPYTLDTGSGAGKVVQDCQYEVLAPFCDYTVQEWSVINETRQSGNDFSPVFANPTLSSSQRLGGQSASYVVVFEGDNGQYTYTVSSLDDFQKFQIGSQWVLKINGFGNIVSVEPAQ